MLMLVWGMIVFHIFLRRAKEAIGIGVLLFLMPNWRKHINVKIKIHKNYQIKVHSLRN